MSALRGLSIDREIAIREEIERRERSVPGSRPDISSILPFLPDVGTSDFEDHRTPLYLPLEESPPEYEQPLPGKPKRGGIGGMDLLRY